MYFQALRFILIFCGLAYIDTRPKMLQVPHPILLSWLHDTLSSRDDRSGGRGPNGSYWTASGDKNAMVHQYLVCSFDIPSVALAGALSLWSRGTQQPLDGSGLACRLPRWSHQDPGPGNKNSAVHIGEVRTRLSRKDGFKLATSPLLSQLQRQTPMKVELVCPYTVLFLGLTQMHPLWEKHRYQSRSHKGWRQVKSHT